MEHISFQNGGKKCENQVKHTSSTSGESLLSWLEDDELGISVPLPKLDMNKEVGAEPLQTSP